MRQLNGKRKPPPLPVERAMPRDEECVLTLAELLATNHWRTGISSRQYARYWGCSESKVLDLLRVARLTMKITISPEAVIQSWNESVGFLTRQMYVLAKTDPRASIIAGNCVAKACGAIMRDHPEIAGINNQNGFQQLVAAGWKPPESFGGLPIPCIEDPDDGRENGECNDGEVDSLDEKRNR